MPNPSRRIAPPVVFVLQYGFWLASFLALYLAYIIEAGDVEMFRYVGF